MLRDNGDLFLFEPGKYERDRLPRLLLDPETRLVHRAIQVPKEKFLQGPFLKPIHLGKVHPMIEHEWPDHAERTALRGLGGALRRRLAEGLSHPTFPPTPFKEQAVATHAGYTPGVEQLPWWRLPWHLWWRL